VKNAENNFTELFKEKLGVTSVVFLLTQLKNGDVRAEVIHSMEDPRLHSVEHFAAICVDHFRLEQSEQEFLSEYAAEPVESYVNGVGMGHILKPRVYKKRLCARIWEMPRFAGLLRFSESGYTVFHEGERLDKGFGLAWI